MEYDDRDLQEAAALLECEDVVKAEAAAAAERGDVELIDKLSTSSVSKSSSATLLDAVLLAGDWAALRRVGADLSRAGLYTTTDQHSRLITAITTNSLVRC